MTIDDKTLDKLAKLSSIELEDSRRDGLKKELEDIVNFVENLNELDVSHVDATFTTIEGGTPLREDESRDSTEVSQHILKHAPKTEDDSFVVPKIIE
jgi:aspartyl-tRNA(Asn)/glutamyl-tRNA(Gln) amidotransferase subunit C